MAQKKYNFRLDTDIVDALDGTQQVGLDFLDMMEITEAALALTADLKKDLEVQTRIVNNYFEKHEIPCKKVYYVINEEEGAIDWLV